MIRLAHVCIESSDLEETERFYRCFGMNRQFEFRNPKGQLIGFYLKFDNVTFLEVILVKTVRPEGGVRHFAIESDDIDLLAECLRQNGYPASKKRMGEDDTWMITTRDPNGVFIEFHQYDHKSMQLHGGSCVIDYSPT